MNENSANNIYSWIVNCFLFFLGNCVFVYLLIDKYSLPHSGYIFRTTLIFCFFFVGLYIIFFEVLPSSKIKKRRTLLLGLTVLICLGIWSFIGNIMQETIHQGANSAIYYFTPGLNKIIPYEFPSLPPPTTEQARAFSVFFVYWLFPYNILFSWAVLLRRSAILGILLTAPILGIVFTLQKLPSNLILALLFAFWITLLAQKNDFRRLPTANALASTGSFVTAFILLLTLLTAFPLDSYRISESVLSLRQTINSRIIGTQFGNLSGGNSRIGMTAPLTSSDGTASLNSAGRLQFPDMTIMRIHSEKPANMYLRGYSSAIYADNSWKQLPEGVFDQGLHTFYSLLYLGTEDAPKLPDIDPYKISVEIPQEYSNFLFTPYLLTDIATESGEFPGIYRDAYIQGGKDIFSYDVWTYSGLNGVDVIDENSAERYFWDLFSSADNQAAYSRDASYQDYIRETYTQLPDSLRSYLLDALPAVREEVPEEFWVQAASEIAGLIKNSGQYSLTPGAQPVNRDFIEYFLSEKKVGYCVHFASATTAALRALGIPARYVEGYIVNASAFDADGWADIPAKNAHAWAEIWLSGVGWVPVESTPGGESALLFADSPPPPPPEQPENSESEQEQEPTTPATITPSVTESTQPGAENTPDTQSPDNPDEPSAPEENNRFPPWLFPTLRWIAGLSILVILFAAFRSYTIHRRKTSFKDEDKNRAVIYIYKYMQRLSRFGPKIPVRATQLSQKAFFSQHTVTNDESEWLLKQALICRTDAMKYLSRWELLKFWLQML